MSGVTSSPDGGTLANESKHVIVTVGENRLGVVGFILSRLRVLTGFSLLFYKENPSRTPIETHLQTITR